MKDDRIQLNTTFCPRNWSRLAPLLVLGLFLASCQKKTPSTSQLRFITRDLVEAAQKAAGRDGEIAIRPEVGAINGSRPRLVADEIFINLSDAAKRSTVERALDRIAARYHLTRVVRASSPEMVRFDYLFNGVRTHSIHIATPSAISVRELAPEPGNTSQLAIIIDDLGSDLGSVDKLLKLPYPLTLSILPNQAHSTEIADQAFRRGDQVMLHLPMEFQGKSAKAEPTELRVGMRSGDVNLLLTRMLDTVPHAVGVNNHEGSRATADSSLMAEVMGALRQRNLYFIDSRTTVATVAYDAAHRAGVRAASRNVFLDDVETRKAILGQLELAARDAQKQGSAIAIGHPHAATLATLSEDLPKLKSRGIHFVFASSLVH